MFYSRRNNIALAHFPKTAGTSLVRWFASVFPDAAYLDAERTHLNVRRSLRLLGVPGCGGLRLFNPVAWLAPSRPSAEDRPLRIIGVLREPFEMLVSLYEFWGRTPMGTGIHPFIESARSGTFRDFLWMAVVQKKIGNYEDFFDTAGVAWSNTRLIDFASLDAGLAAVCDEFGIRRGPRLERLNAGTGRQRNLAAYQAEAGTLISNVHSHFRWYYEHGVHLMVRGAGALRAAA